MLTSPRPHGVSSDGRSKAQRLANNAVLQVLTGFLATLVLGVLVRPVACAAEPDVETRIQHIETGLLPPVIVAGEPVPHFTLAERMSALHVPGVSVAYFHHGEIAWARGFGVTKVGGPAVTADTLFQAGSISKPVSAMAALALVQAGRLGLDVDVNDTLKSWKVPASRFTATTPVTLRALLSHTAGTTVHGFAGYAAGAAVPSLIQVLNGLPPANNDPIIVTLEPGTAFRYSGGGYEIMQQMLIDATGEPFDRLLQRTVLTPLGMSHSSFWQPLPADRQADAAMPYLASGEPVDGGAHTYPELAAAGLWTTPSDLAHFAIAVQDALVGRANPVLSQAMAREMVTPRLDHYGLGLEIGGSTARPYFDHEGVDFGFVSLIVAYESGDGAVIMTNGWRETLMLELVRAIAAEYDWPDFYPVQRTLATVDPDVFDRYLGNYRLEPLSVIAVTRTGNRLFAQVTGQPRFELFPEGGDDYFLRAVNARITFRLDGHGKATGLVLHQGGNDRVAPRVE